ncbi:hypothetical protein Ancab_023246 [Ancistrocladus abbreviatus]
MGDGDDAWVIEEVAKSHEDGVLIAQTRTWLPRVEHVFEVGYLPCTVHTIKNVEDDALLGQLIDQVDLPDFPTSSNYTTIDEDAAYVLDDIAVDEHSTVKHGIIVEIRTIEELGHMLDYSLNLELDHST